MIEYKQEKSIKDIILEIISNIIVNMIVIILASKLYKNIYVENLYYTFIVAILIMILNKSIKPILNAIMLPINIYTLGITYPFTNVFLLKIISLILNNHFILNGWLCAFFISIFISVMTLIIDILVGKQIRSV